MIAIRFENGKAVCWKYPCGDLAELKPTSEGFALYDWEGESGDILYLTESGGALIKARLAELDMDINACMDGVGKVKTESEYRAERILLRNELRVLEGKEPLKGKEESE